MLFERELEELNVFYYDNEIENDDYHSLLMRIDEEIVEGEIGDKLCRGYINNDYIRKQLDQRKIKGFFVKNMDMEYVGMILFKVKKGGEYIDLRIIGTEKNIIKKRNLKIGQYLMFLLEDYARKNNIKVLKCKGIKESIDFYMKNCWSNKGEGKEKNTYDLEKNLDDSMDIDCDDIQEMIDDTIQQSYDYEDYEYDSDEEKIL
jgi:hypothetical protein